jgi:hypothetical protein
MKGTIKYQHFTRKERYEQRNQLRTFLEGQLPTEARGQ